jgi:hypothetical protein
MEILFYIKKKPKKFIKNPEKSQLNKNFQIYKYIHGLHSLCHQSTKP